MIEFFLDSKKILQKHQSALTQVKGQTDLKKDISTISKQFYQLGCGYIQGQHHQHILYHVLKKY
jgi:hypothetical protein